MKILGIDADRALPSLQRLRPAEATGRQAAQDWMPEAFAAAAWSGIAEPADRVAGLLVRMLGAAGALTALVERCSPTRLRAQLRAASEEVSADDAAGSGTAHGDTADCTEEQLADAFARWMPRLSAAATLRGIEQGVRVGARLLLPADQHWPGGLRDLGDHAPLALWVRGSPHALCSAEAVAVIGARAATGYGEHVAAEFAQALAQRGHPVVSGAAYGIDGMAHRAALAAEGLTVAFLAGGVDRSYPGGHEQLLSSIASAGAVCAETLPGTAPTKWRFLMRNRLIAASTALTVVVEAGWRSGSLNTAGHAASLGRPVAAVPGPVTSPASAGCHRLIREYGAQLVCTAAEALELIPESAAPRHAAEDGLDAAGPPQKQPEPILRDVRPSAEQLRLLDALSTRQERSVQELCRRSGLSPTQARTAIGLLQALGRIGEGPSGGWRKLVPGG